MAGNISDYLENKLLEHALGKTIFASPTTTWLGLYTVAPTDSTSGTEVTGGSYARQQITWNAASAGSITNNGNLVFPTATALWGTVLAVAILDASTVGNILFYGPLADTKTIANTDTFTIVSGQLTVTLD